MLHPVIEACKMAVRSWNIWKKYSHCATHCRKGHEDCEFPEISSANQREFSLLMFSVDIFNGKLQPRVCHFTDISYYLFSLYDVITFAVVQDALFCVCGAVA